MTQLLTFFILLFSVSEIKENKLHDIFRSFRTYFRIDVPAQGYTLRSMEDRFRALSKKALQVPDQRGREGNSAVPIPQTFGKFVSVEVKDESITLSVAAESLFEPGSAALAPSAAEHLEAVAREIQGYWTRLLIIGHASPLPLPPGSPFPDHLTLGWARAKAVSDALAGYWRRAGHPNEALRLAVESRGSNDPPKEWADESRYDRVEIVFTAEPVRRRTTLKRLAIEREADAGRERRGGT